MGMLPILPLVVAVLVREGAGNGGAGPRRVSWFNSAGGWTVGADGRNLSAWLDVYGPRSALPSITGTMPCCGCWATHPNGSFYNTGRCASATGTNVNHDPSEAARLKALNQVVREQGLSIEPTGAFTVDYLLKERWMLPGSLESAVSMLDSEGWTGLGIDNENFPPAMPMALPEMFGRLLGNLSKVMTAANKTVVVDVCSTWKGDLGGPDYLSGYAKRAPTNVRFMDMAQYFSHGWGTLKVGGGFVNQKKLLPLSAFATAVGLTEMPGHANASCGAWPQCANVSNPACGCIDYGWNHTQFAAFVKDVEEAGITEIDIYRQDMTPPPGTVPAIPPWMMTELAGFLARGGSSPTPAPPPSPSSGGGARLTLVPDPLPSLVAEVPSLLYYPLLQHVFHDHAGTAATILLRAQTSPDVDVPCYDSTFASYDQGRNWHGPLAPENGTRNIQKRVCFPYPPAPSQSGANASGVGGESALCLPYARDASRDTEGAPLTADFAGTIWRRDAATGVLSAERADAVVVKFSDPHMVEGQRRYTDGNAVRALDGKGWLLTLYATDGIHRQTMPLSVHVYYSVNLLSWQFRARLGTSFLASENSMVRLKDSRLMMVFRSELPQKKLFQTFSADDGFTWSEPSTLSGVGPGGDPHSCEPKLARVGGDVGALVLASGRGGQFIWYADEDAHATGGGHIPIEAAEWQSFDIRGYHDAALRSTHPDWVFEPFNTGISTGYASLSLLPDHHLVVAYDRMPKGQGHGAPPPPGSKDRIFALRFAIKRGTAPPPPPPSPAPPPSPPSPPSPHWSPNATCQTQADSFCMASCFHKIAGHTPDCGDGPMVARCSGASDTPPRAAPRWRCYGVATLSSDNSSYVQGSCYCSMTAQIRTAFARCGEPAPPGVCAAQPPPPPPLATPGLTIFKDGDAGYACFRIPSLLVLSNGRRLAFAEARKNCLDGPYGDKIDVVLKVSLDSGRVWGPLRQIYGEEAPLGKAPVWISGPLPVLLHDEAHKDHVVLLFTRGNHDVLTLRSRTGGDTWESHPTDITEQVVPDSWKYVATGPAAGVQLPSRRLVVCCDHATSASPDKRHIVGASTSIRSHSLFSDDFGCVVCKGSLLSCLPDRSATRQAHLECVEFSSERR
jgi:hypothetical protein